ncbi:MAG: transcriptional regulator, partial [Rhodobacterales bacterium 17-64-5]
FPANVPDGHHFFNRSGAVAQFLVVGSKSKREVATYSDVDLVLTVEAGQASFAYKDGSTWEGPR